MRRIVVGVLCLFLSSAVSAKMFENRLIGTPEVQCGPDDIRIKGVSEDIFEGQIFVKRHRRVPECFVVFDVEQNSTSPEFSIPLDKIAACGIDMKRNSEQKSLELKTVISVSFHPELITAGDRTYSVNCVFQQQQMTVATNLDFISDITPKATLESEVDRPLLSLSIVAAEEGLNVLTSPTPKMTASVKVGHPLMLVWTLTQSSPLYGLRILACTVESPNGEGLRIIDNACSVMGDGLVSDVRYSDDQTRAFADVKAFKYPDYDETIFKCAVKTCIRRFEHLVVGADTDTSDLCPEPTDCARLFNRPETNSSSLRFKRSLTSDLLSIDATAEVLEGRITMIDEYGSHKQAPSHAALMLESSLPDDSDICLSSPFAATVVSVCLLIIFTTVIVVLSMIASRVREFCSSTVIS